MSVQTILKEFSFCWDEQKILIRIGSKKGLKSASPSLLRLVRDAKSRIQSLLTPQAVVTLLPYEDTNGHPVFNNAVMVALCVATIGPGAENACEQYFKDGDALKGLVWDTFGSEAVAQVVRQAEGVIVQEALRKSLWPSKKFSPGYRGWPLEEQRFLFKKVDASAIGVRLNDSCMMIPRKSISFRINFYSDRRLTTRRL
jgi:hypothetical protein